MASSVIVMFIVTGLVGGFIAGVLGVGGGVLFVPCLHLGFLLMGIPTDTAFLLAVGTSLSVIIITSLSSSLGHLIHGNIDPRAVAAMAVLSVPSSFLGAAIGASFGGHMLERFFGLFAIFTAIQFIRQPDSNGCDPDKDASYGQYMLVGGVSGLASPILGIGGGIITVSILHLGMGVPMLRCVANSSGVIIFTSIAGTIGWIFAGWGVEGLPLLSLGYVNLLATILISFGAMVAAFIGAWLADRLDSDRLRLPFALVLIGVGIKMAFF